MTFTNDWGETASTLEEIERKTLAHMPEEDLVGKLTMTEGRDAIIRWALHQPEFQEKFKDLIKEAERDWIDWQGNIYEEEEDEEEEEEKSGTVVYSVFELNHGLIGVAKDYKSAVQLLIDTDWLTAGTGAWDEEKNAWDTLENTLGANWADTMKGWTREKFNDFWTDSFSIDEQEVFEKTS